MSRAAVGYACRMSEDPQDKQPSPAKDKGPEAAPEYAPAEDGSSIADGTHSASALGEEGPAGERMDG
jgi:hypothetical protein